LRDLNSVKKIDINSTKLSYSIALASLSTILFSSIFAQLYLLPFNPLSGIGHVNKVYAEGELKLKISVDQDPIQQGDTQKVTVIIRDANSNDKIGDAFIKLAIEPPSGKIGTGTANTDDNGQATFNIHISSDADTGTFNVAARASENGYASKTVTTSFEVVSNGNNNGENNGNGNSNDDHDGHGHPHGGNNNNNDQVQVISQSNDCGNGKFSSDIKCQNIGNQIQGGGGHKNGGHHGGQSQSATQANVCGNGKGASDINCQNLSNQIQGDGNAVNVIGVQSGGSGGSDGGSSHGDGNDNGGNDGQTGQLGVQQSGGDGSGGNGGGHHGGQSQSAAQANVCGNGKGASDINCQNLSNQIQGDGNAVNVIGVQSGGSGGSDGGSSHGDGNDNGGNDGQTGQLGVQQSGGDGSGGNGGGHHGGQSQSAAQANVCGNGKGASDINCQNLSNQIQGDGNAVNVIGVQPDNSVDTNQYPSLNDQSNAEFARAVHSYSNNGDEFGTGNSANSNPFSDACNQAINRHVAVGGLHGEMASQMRGQICG
jgi:hypothetical protein